MILCIVYRLSHLPIFLLKNTRNSVFGIECFRVDVLPIDEPLDVNVDAAGDDDVGQDGVAVEDDLGLETVGGLRQHSFRHLDSD